MVKLGPIKLVICQICRSKSRSSSLYDRFLTNLKSSVLNNFPDPWFYKTGVFDGKFDDVIGQGASGIVLKGEWFGRKAAFKFVEIGSQKYQERSDVALKSLNEKLTEMISIQSTAGSKIISFYGHYR